MFLYSLNLVIYILSFLLSWVNERKYIIKLAIIYVHSLFLLVRYMYIHIICDICKENKIILHTCKYMSSINVHTIILVYMCKELV